MTSRRAGVFFAVPVEAAFDFLVDPRNRPAWQPSLRRVELLDDGEPHVGQRWLDVTVPGLRPRMSTVVLDRPRRWVERGQWRGVEAEGELTFSPVADGCPVGCTVAVAARVRGRGWRRPLGPVLTLVAGLATGPDLRRAARILTERGPGQ
ncbi:MAG TPA: SRPBCC family protein [Actinomycetales bacterium]|nr:SRPBCC family protein [Actinomycetales bacterium]